MEWKRNYKTVNRLYCTFTKLILSFSEKENKFFERLISALISNANREYKSSVYKIIGQYAIERNEKKITNIVYETDDSFIQTNALIGLYSYFEDLGYDSYRNSDYFAPLAEVVDQILRNPKFELDEYREFQAINSGKDIRMRVIKK